MFGRGLLPKVYDRLRDLRLNVERVVKDAKCKKDSSEDERRMCDRLTYPIVRERSRR